MGRPRIKTPWPDQIVDFHIEAEGDGLTLMLACERDDAGKQNFAVKFGVSGQADPFGAVERTATGAELHFSGHQAAVAIRLLSDLSEQLQATTR